MDDQRIGLLLRAIRHKKSWRQDDVSRKARLSQDLISRAELGGIAAITVGALRRIAKVLGAEVVVNIRWRGADLDRLLDEGHASLVGALIELLQRAGWEVHPEISYSIYGERGSYDLLAWHEGTRTLLVVEVKTELASVEATVRILDAKVRLAPEVALDRFGWQPAYRAHILVLPERSTQRRQVERHQLVFQGAFPVRGRELRAWLSSPDRSIGGLLFLSPTTGLRGKSAALSRKRIRLTNADLAEREADGQTAKEAA